MNQQRTMIVGKPQKKLLYEVSIIRPIVIFLLVFLHSFTKIANGGRYSNNYQLDNVYRWICWFVSGFRIETIALVAGYVFAYQSLDLNRKIPFCQFLIKKFKRLIIPMLVFGFVYYFLFLFDRNSFTIVKFLVKLLSGCGHLWFLPMLFWCFIAIWLIDHYKLSSKILLAILACWTLIPMPYVPFGFAKMPHFLFFVYAGYYLWIYHGKLWKKYLNTTSISIMWLVYIVLVIARHLLLSEPSNTTSKFQTLFFEESQSIIELSMSCAGILALYLNVCFFTNRATFKPKQWIIRASDDCYGVYVFHQFILVGIYFFTPLVEDINPLLVPWIGLFFAFSFSLILTKVFLKTRFGKFLIG